jgi:hypothetical protein
MWQRWCDSLAAGHSVGLRPGFRGKFRALHGADPPIAAAPNGLNENWVVGGIAQRVAQALDGAADGAIKIHKYIARPKCLAEFFVGDDFVGVAEQKSQHTEGQILKMDLDPVPAEFASTQVGFEHTEPDYGRRRLCRAHKTTRRRRRLVF